MFQSLKSTILNNTSSVLLIVLSMSFLYSCSNSNQPEQYQQNSSDPIIGDHHFLSGYEPLTPDSLVNVIIEIPAGTDAKWEVEKDTGHISWEIRDGEPRVINYLPYPGNYGMVPRTLAGDGDSIDAIVIGSAMERGVISKTRLIGVLELLDGGEQDDKLIVVPVNSQFSHVDNMEELNELYPGIATIIEIWFDNYKGPGNNVEIKGIADVDRAWEILGESIENYN